MSNKSTQGKRTGRPKKTHLDYHHQRTAYRLFWLLERLPDNLPEPTPAMRKAARRLLDKLVKTAGSTTPPKADTCAVYREAVRAIIAQTGTDEHPDVLALRDLAQKYDAHRRKIEAREKRAEEATKPPEKSTAQMLSDALACAQINGPPNDASLALIDALLEWVRFTLTLTPHSLDLIAAIYTETKKATNRARRATDGHLPGDLEEATGELHGRFYHHITQDKPSVLPPAAQDKKSRRVDETLARWYGQPAAGRGGQKPQDADTERRLRELRDRLAKLDADEITDSSARMKLETEIYNLEHPPAASADEWPEYIDMKGGTR